MQQNEQATTEEDLEEKAFQDEMNAEIDAPAPVVKQEPEADSQIPESEESNQEGEQQQEAKPERVEVVEGFTAEEVKAALAEIPRLRKGLDTLGGTYGERVASLQRTIEELKSQRQQAAEHTQQQIQSKMSPERFAELKQEFPELGGLIEKAFSDFAPPQIDLSSFDNKLQAKFDEERQARTQEQLKRELRLLKREHPDFAEIAGYAPAENGLIQWNNPAFGQWLLTQPNEVQQQVIQGDDAFDIADIITAYKESLKNAQDDTPKPSKKTNLEKAVQPRGSPATRLTSNLDEEERLFQEELAKEEYY